VCEYARHDERQGETGLQKYFGEELDYQHAPGDYLGLDIDVA
jgi:hypothetical protein